MGGLQLCERPLDEIGGLLERPLSEKVGSFGGKINKETWGLLKLTCGNRHHLENTLGSCDVTFEMKKRILWSS